MAVIKNRTLVCDSWQRLDSAAEALPRRLGEVVVPLTAWKARRGDLLTAARRVGVLLAGSDDPGELAGDVEVLDLIAVEFPKLADGRGYTIARLLRERYGWRGELRAVGDVQRDQLTYLERCGFDAFELRPGEDAEGAVNAFNELTERYQGDVLQPSPLFRRRAPATA